MLAIKLQRVGKKHQPSYRIVVAEKRSKLGGPPVEQVGVYNPATKTASLEKERVLYWLKAGAQPTVSVHNLLVRQGAISGPKIAVKIRKSETVSGAAAAPASQRETAPTLETKAETAAEESKPAAETGN